MNDFYRDENFNEYQRQMDIASVRASRSYGRFPLILALVGLALSVFFGLGGIVAVVSLVLAAVRYKEKKLTTLKWAIVISVVTIAVSAIYIFSVFAAIFTAILEEAEEAAEIITLLL